MSTPYDGRRRIAPAGERAEMRKEIRLMEADEKGESPEISRDMKKHLTQGKGSTGANRAILNRMKKTLANSEPDDLSAQDVAALEKEEKELSLYVKGKMVPKKGTALSPSIKGTANPDFRKAVNLMARDEMSQEYLAKAHRLKNIRRQLRPDDPNAGNIEDLRPAR